MNQPSETAPRDCGELDLGAGLYIVDRKPFLEAVRTLSRLSNGRAVLAIASQWAVIAAMVLLAVGTLRFFAGHLNLARALSELAPAQLLAVGAAYLIAGFIIGTRQHALGVLMHDAAHWRLFSNRTANDVLSDLLCAFPIGVSTSLYRRTHLEHHRYTSTEQDPDWITMQNDPDWHWPKTQLAAAKLLIGDLLGLTLQKTLRLLSKWAPLAAVIGRNPDGRVLSRCEAFLYAISMLSLAALLTAIGGWLHFLLLWLLPSFTVLAAIMRLRSIAEHLVLPNTDELTQTRHVAPTLIERLIIAPFHINVHIAHHMFPSIPHYNLPKMQALLMKDETFRSRAHLVRGYWSPRHGVLAELLVRRRMSRQDGGARR